MWKHFVCIFEPWLDIRSAILNFQLEKLCYSHYILLRLFLCLQVHTYVCVYVCMYVCMYECMYVYVNM